MNKLENYGLIRFSQRTGKIDNCFTALGRGMLQIWALQNTTKTKACAIINIDTREQFSEYIGTADGFPIVNKGDFVFSLSDKLYDSFAEQIDRDNQSN